MNNSFNDPRQIEYVKMHTESYGTDRLVIDGRTYAERVLDHQPTDDSIRAAMNKHPGYFCYLWSNMRGFAVVFRSTNNESMFDWGNLIYLGRS